MENRVIYLRLAKTTFISLAVKLATDEHEIRSRAVLFDVIHIFIFLFFFSVKIRVFPLDFGMKPSGRNVSTICRSFLNLNLKSISSPLTGLSRNYETKKFKLSKMWLRIVTGKLEGEPVT